MGSPSSITLTESEMSSRADRYFADDESLDFIQDVRVCIHDGFAEATGTLNAIGLEVEVKFEGTMNLTGDTPKLQIDDIDMGKVPGWPVDLTDAILSAEGDVNKAFEDIKLRHTYTATLMEGEARIDGVP